MKLSELIQQASQMLVEKGDLDVLDEEGFCVISVRFREFEEDDQRLNANKGDKVAWIHADR